MIRLIRRLFDNPSAQDDDPAAWLGNQMAHAFFVSVLVMMPCMMFGMTTAHDWLWWNAPWFASAVYALFWEMRQWLRGAGPVDCLTDWLFVTCGAVAVHAGMNGDEYVFCLSLAGIVLAGALGAIRRA